MKRNGYSYKNTGKKMSVRWDYYGWNFARTIWVDDNSGEQFIRVNGLFWNIDEVKYGCDNWSIVF